MTRFRTASAALAIASTAALLTACSSDDESPETSAAPESSSTAGAEAAAEPVTLTWWHNSVAGDNGQNDLGDYWQKMADDFTAENPHVTIEIEQIQNEDLQRTRIPLALQSGDAPDLFQAWGGGELATQVESGYLMDLTDTLADDIERLGGGVAPWQHEGSTYGLPFQFGVEGIWYRESLFEEAGITEEPTTMAELGDAVQALKDADITPVAVGAADGWPAAHWWYNFALRSCPQDVISTAGTTFDFSHECWVDAGEQLEEFLGIEPFQDQFISTVAQTGATSSAGLVATGEAAMELMGHWNVFVYEGFTDGTEEGIQALHDDLGWFPMPATDGGEGAPSAALGGGDGFSCYVDAPAECAEFLSFIMSDENQAGAAEAAGILPVAPAAADAVTNPVLVELSQVAGSAEYVQLWLDTSFGTNVGGAMNDGIVNIFAGTGDAQDVVDLMSAAALTQ